MKNQHGITFILFSYNEEKRISYAIKNFIKYGEVIVFEAVNTSKTKEIAENLGARFVLRPPSDKPQVETQENFEAIKKIAETDWIYWGYVDNIAPKSLVEKMIEISRQDKYKMVYIPLHTFIWGNTKNIILKSHAPMLFHKDYADFSKNYIHGMGQFNLDKKEILKLPSKKEFALKHFSTYDIHKFVLSHLRYAETEAIEKHQKGVKFSTIKMLAAMIRYCWIYGKLSYKSGVLGLIIILSYSFFRLMAYAKLYELEHDINIEDIEKKYSLEKENLLKQFE